MGFFFVFVFFCVKNSLQYFKNEVFKIFILDIKLTITTTDVKTSINVQLMRIIINGK